MPRSKLKPREVIKLRTYEEVMNRIFSEPIPKYWRKGQFVFNRASLLFGDNITRSINYDPFYKDENIKPFVTALVEALNKSN